MSVAGVVERMKRRRATVAVAAGFGAGCGRSREVAGRGTGAKTLGAVSRRAVSGVGDSAAAA